MLPPELILCCSAAATGLYDLSSGSSVLTFKQGQASHDDLAATGSRKTCTYVAPRNGMGGLVMAMQGAGKGALNVWSFAKEATLQRSILPAKLSCIALSTTGTYLVGGTDAGRLFLWETATGALVSSFDAHYRAISCLTWTQDNDGAFLSGSDDAAVHVWSVASLLASSTATDSSQPSPYATLRDHTLPVTDIAIGAGRFPRLRVLTASVDGSCKLWYLLHPSSTLLCTFTFPAPFSSLTRVAFDELERYFFVAADPQHLLSAPRHQEPQESGSMVRRVDLYRKRPDESFAAASDGAIGDNVTVTDGKSYSTREPVTAMHLSRHSPSLLLGLQTGQILVLALPSLQLVNTVLPTPAPAPAITFLSSVLRPIDLISRANLGGRGQGTNRPDDAYPVRPVGKLARTMEEPARRLRNHVVHLRLAEHRDVSHLVSAPLPPDVLPASAIAAGASRSGGDGTRMSELQSENAALREQLARAININDVMWQTIVDGALAPGLQLK